MKITRYTESRGEFSRSPRLSAQEKAAMAAVEKSLSRYVRLICGHFTTKEEILVYAAWQAKADRFYCEKCGTWVNKAKPQKNIIPDEPLF